MNKEEYWKRRLTSEQRQAIMCLDMLQRSFAVSAEALKNRMGDYRYINRDVGLMRKRTEVILRRALDGIPQDTASMLLRQSRDYALRPVQINTVERKDEVNMPRDDLWQFVRIVINNCCTMCVKTGGECDECKIRKLLQTYTDEPDRRFRECGYQYSEAEDDV